MIKGRLSKTEESPPVKLVPVFARPVAKFPRADGKFEKPGKTPVKAASPTPVANVPPTSFAPVAKVGREAVAPAAAVFDGLGAGLGGVGFGAAVSFFTAGLLYRGILSCLKKIALPCRNELFGWSHTSVGPGRQSKARDLAASPPAGQHDTPPSEGPLPSTDGRQQQRLLEDKRSVPRL